MHREVIHGRKVPAIMISIVSITIALYIIEIFELSSDNSLRIYDLLEITLLFFIIGILIKEYKQSRMTYKYSIIADKLIINKLNTKGDETLESIKVQDIVFLGKKLELPKELSKVKCHGSYLSYFITPNKYHCVYKRNGKLEKFVFEPSERLVNRVNNKMNI